MSVWATINGIDVALAVTTVIGWGLYFNERVERDLDRLYAAEAGDDGCRHENGGV